MSKLTTLPLAALLLVPVTALHAAEQSQPATGRQADGVQPTVREIASARYAPPDMYMKDHCLIRKDGQWHLFAPLGKVGTMWQHDGSEESAEHMVSDDLVHWKLLGTAVSASKREGYFDRLMGGIAPQVIPYRYEYLMFYAGWDFKSKTPLDMQGQRSGIGLAQSKDLVKWETPPEFAKDGLAPKGSDQCVVRDDAQRRWLMYVGRPGAVAVYQNMDDWRKDLTYWEEAGLALSRSDLAGGTTDMNPGESPFVMRHPRSGKWIIFVNGGYAVSEDSLKFPRVQPYPFNAGVFLFPKPHDEGKGTFYHADDDGAGFAHEIIEFNGQWYLTGVVGTDGHTRLKFTPIEWTKGAFVLTPDIAPSTRNQSTNEKIITQGDTRTAKTQETEPQPSTKFSKIVTGGSHMNRLTASTLAALLLAPLTALHATETTAAQPIDRETLDKWSAPYRGWHYHPDYVISADPKIPGNEDFKNTDVPCVYQLPGQPDKWHMSFIGFNGKGYNSFVAESTNLVRWTNLKLAMGFGKEGYFDFGGCVIGSYLYESYDIKAPRLLKKRDGMYWTLYGCYPKQDGYECDPGYEGVATSEDGMSWKRAKDKYILSVHEPDVGAWEKQCIYQPWLVEYQGLFYDFYNAKQTDGGYHERMGFATSTNLLDWKRYEKNPVLDNRPGNYDDNFCADGKVFRDGDHWVMFYFGVGKGGAHIMVAFSRDLMHWTAHPEPLYKAGGNPSGLDKQFAHKISLVYNPKNEMFYLYYCACGSKGRGIGLITSKPLQFLSPTAANETRTAP